jgi:uncharacterized protein
MNLTNLRNRVEQVWSERYIPAHDIKHTLRVAALARRIATHEGADPDEAEAAGLLHDLGRLAQDEEEGHAEAGVGWADSILRATSEFSDDARERILSAVRQHSQLRSHGLLANIIQDADKLEGLGAVGLMRAYVSKSHLIDYPEGVIAERGSIAARNISEQIAFQMEWFDMLYTRTAKDMGGRRYRFMQAFMTELKRDVDEAGCQVRSQ